MKKLFLFTILLVAAFSSLNAQTIFTSYSFNVEPKDESKVLELYKNYFGNKANLIKGVTVSLYENHFKAKDIATHEVIFTGTPEAMGAGYDGKSTDAWKLFQSELSKYCVGVRSAEGKRFSGFGDTSSVIYPIQDVYFVKVKNQDEYKAKFDAYWSKNITVNTRISLGSVNTISENGTTHYVVRSYKDFTTKFKDADQNVKAYNEYLSSLKDIRTFITSQTRVLLGKW